MSHNTRVPSIHMKPKVCINILLSHIKKVSVLELIKPKVHVDKNGMKSVVIWDTLLGEYITIGYDEFKVRREENMKKIAALLEMRRKSDSQLQKKSGEKTLFDLLR